MAGRALAAAGRVGALVAALGTIALAALFAWHAGVFFWAEVAPVVRSRSLNSQADFAWFYYAMQTARAHAGARLYNLAAEDAFMRARGFAYDTLDVYGYPPQFALLFAPLAALPYVAARALWTRINLAALAIGLGAGAWLASPRPGIARLLLLGFGGLFVTALQSNFYWGQPNAIILALVALGLLGVCGPVPRAWKAAAGGVAIGLATVLKVTPIAVLAYLTARWLLPALRRRGDARSAAAGRGALAGWATVGCTSVLCGLELGWATLPTYLRRAIPQVERSAWAHGPAPWNQGLRGILMLYEHSNRLLGHQSDAFAVAVCALAVVVPLMRPNLDRRVDAALAALLVLLPWPSLESHHFTTAILPGVLLCGYLLDRVASWRRAWLWPLAGLVGVAGLALVAPDRLHWPPPIWPVSGAAIRVPPARYTAVYLLGAATYGPVRWELELRYRGVAPGRVNADWPDWWSPGDPLAPALAGEAVKAGTVAHAPVGLYAFGYPVAAGAELTALGLPGRLPQQDGGPEGLHLVAVTLRRAAGGLVQVALPYDADGIAPAVAYAPPQDDSFDGRGDEFWTSAWPGGVLRAEIGGVEVPFALPDRRAAHNVLSDPAPARAGVLTTVFADAPDFVAIALLFGVAVVTGLLDAPPSVP